MKKLISLVLALAMIACVAAGCAPATNDNKEPAAQKFEGTMEELVTKITTEQPVEIMGGGAMALDLANAGELPEEDFAWYIANYTGLENGNDISDGAFYESMVGAIAFSLVAVRVNEGVDAKTVGEAMKNGIDTRKWICVSADELMVAGYGDVVMLIMLDSGLGMTAQSFVDAFKTVCGADLSFILN